LLHTYPELGVAVLICVATATTWRAATISTPRVQLRDSLVPIVLATVFLLLIMPSWRALATLLHAQADAAMGATRPGEGMFLGLTVPRHVVAGWWALGSEHGYAALLGPRTLLGLALFGLLLVGAVTLVDERRTSWLIWLALPFGLAPLLILRQGYAYGAYKAIVMGWWFMAFLLVRGAASRTGAIWRLAAPVIIASLPAVAIARLLIAPVSRTFRMPRPESMATFRAVREVPPVVGRDPIVLAVHDEEAAEWAVYYLRDVPMALFTDERYLVAKAAALARSRPVDLNDVRWIVTDAPGRAAALSPAQTSTWTLRWRSGPYALWEAPPGSSRSLIGTFALDTVTR
jgi:hypothetical protein